MRFRWKDYADGDRVKVMALEAAEFIRFLLHVVPDGLVRIRHFGLLADRTRRAKLARCRHLMAHPTPAAARPVESVHALMLRLTGIDIDRCPVCQQGAPAPQGDPAAGTVVRSLRAHLGHLVSPALDRHPPPPHLIPIRISHSPSAPVTAGPPVRRAPARDAGRRPVGPPDTPSGCPRRPTPPALNRFPAAPARARIPIAMAGPRFSPTGPSRRAPAWAMRHRSWHGG